MIKMNPVLSQLLATQRRPETDPEYTFIKQRQSNIRQALGLVSDSIFGLLDEHALIAAELAYIAVPLSRKTAISKGYYEEQPQVLRLTATALRKAQARQAQGTAATTTPVTTPP